jgi:hypothetical protein
MEWQRHRRAGGCEFMASHVDRPPGWLEVLDNEDTLFLRRFVLASGSLKDLASEYGVSYRTVRARLDRLISKVRAAGDPSSDDPFERKLRILVAEGRITARLARELKDDYRIALERRERP